MPDEFDNAQQLEQAHRDAAIARVRHAAAKSQGEGSEECSGCGGDIPQERRDAVPGATQCVGCQTLTDRARRFRR